MATQASPRIVSSPARRYPLVDHRLPRPAHPLPMQEITATVVHFQQGESISAWMWRTLYEAQVEYVDDDPIVGVIDGDTPLVFMDLRTFERLVNDDQIARSTTRAGGYIQERFDREAQEKGAA